jgi:hypothetical protein
MVVQLQLVRNAGPVIVNVTQGAVMLVHSPVLMSGITKTVSRSGKESLTS